MRWQTSAAVAFAAMVAALPAAASEFVVVEAASAPFQPGQVIKGAEPIALPAGGTLTVIGETGTVSRLSGPINGSLNALAGASPAAGGVGSPGDDVVGTISRLLQSGTGPKGKSLLTVRAAATTATRPRIDPHAILSAVELLTPGSYCLDATVRPDLLREPAPQVRTVRLTDVSTGKVAIVEFPAQADSAPWPASLPIEDGAIYSAQAYETGATHEFTLYRLPATLASDAHRIAWMVDHGCLDQARLLLQQVAAASGS